MWCRLGVRRGGERRRERRDRKGGEAWGWAVERVGVARGCARRRTGREGGEGGEVICIIRDAGRLGSATRVGGRHGDGLVIDGAEGEAV